jgi:hypothetical protein
MDTDSRGPDLDRAIAALRDRPPTTDLWPGIAGRITRRPRGTLQLRWPAALAAGVALIAATASLTLWLRPGNSADPVAARSPARSATATTTDSALVLPAGFGEATSTLSRAIDELEAAVAAAAPSLDAAAQQRLRASLAALDAAIADARTRAGRAPDDVGAARYLTRTMQRKLDALQTVATMVGRS